ncbi:uncharacterized protein N7529_007782 [Penicillium soppii]|uniref:uncharacterized protein n=1 Tax=Penicillium soppii TaxID=69789 RepID=UPI0025469FA8|nr:uncharacterized protein N7529_007782 [Penicillium soppii]KAJ5860472.1 hypothetical protein N7529_007782 [Penicillium soppii]
MRYTMINGLVLLAVSPLTALALPVDPNDQAGQWDPSGQYRKGHWQNGEFIANGDNRYNQNGDVDQNGQWRENDQNDQNGWTDADGEWHANNQNDQNGWTDANGQWHANQKRELRGQATSTTNGARAVDNAVNKVNNPQVTPSSQGSKYQSYGNYKNYGSYQNYPANPQDQNQDKDIKANAGQQE